MGQPSLFNGRVHYILTLVYKSLNVLAPEYITDMFSLKTHSINLRASGTNSLLIPLLRMACILCLITVANCGTPPPTRPGLCQLLQVLNPLFVIQYLILTAVPFVNSCKFYLTVSIVNILYVLVLLHYIYFITLIYFLGDISISLAILNSKLNKGLLLLLLLLLLPEKKPFERQSLCGGESSSDSLASRRKKAGLYTMYKITHNIIHVNKDKYLRPTRETRRRGTHYFKYYIEFSNIDQ